MDYYGFLRHLRIREELTKTMDFFSEDLIAVVRSIDSGHSRESLEKAMKFHDLSYDVLNGNICLSRKNLQCAISDKLFTGFDEVWLFAGFTPKKDLSEVPAATSDGQDFSENLHLEILEAFHETECFVLLGDGCGLNYLTNNLAIAEELARQNKAWEEEG